jgi:peroxiredoxin
MKTFLQITTASVIIFTTIFSTACNKGSTDAAPAKGLKTAPDFNLKNLAGGMVKLSDYRGKVVILDFWATWCPPCIKEIPDFVELQKEYGDKGLIILGISLDQNPKQALPAFIKKYKVNYPILLTDGKVDKAFGGVTGIPTTFVIDQKGEIYKQYVGFRPKQVFETDIKALLGL